VEGKKKTCITNAVGPWREFPKVWGGKKGGGEGVRVQVKFPSQSSKGSSEDKKQLTITEDCFKKWGRAFRRRSREEISYQAMKDGPANEAIQPQNIQRQK